MPKTKKEKSKTSKALIIIFAVIVIMVFASLGADEDNKEVVNNMTAVEKMEVAFNGDYNQREIKEKISKAMNLYGTPLTEENYSRAGSALVVLRQDSGIDEILILDKMIENHVPGVNMDFASAAGIAVTTLELGIY